jgi:hypothetical protein
MKYCIFYVNSNKKKQSLLKKRVLPYKKRVKRAMNCRPMT